MNAIGIHIYSGGFTCGIRQAGFEILGQWEELDAGYETAKLNFPDADHPLGPPDDWPLERFANKVDLVFANPPCAPWSPAGSRLGLADPRVQYTRDVAMAALNLSPEFLVIESVPRAWSPTGGQLLYLELAEDFKRHGYGVTILFTNAVLHGTAQSRARFHFIAHTKELRFTMPQLEDADIVTVRKAIADLEDAPDNWAGSHVRQPYDERALNVVQHLEEGEGWGTGYERAVKKGLSAVKGRFVSGRLRYDAPSATILDIGALTHPTSNRAITMREAARLCGYPDDFFFARPARDKWWGGMPPEVTQAVMPPVARYLGEVFYNCGQAVRTPELTVVDWRREGRRFSPHAFAARQREAVIR